jgi:hypothetical protein
MDLPGFIREFSVPPQSVITTVHPKRASCDGGCLIQNDQYNGEMPTTGTGSIPFPILCLEPIS